MHDTFEDLVADKANGNWICTAVLQRTRTKRDGTPSVQTWTWSHGPYPTQKEAKARASKLRREFQQDIAERPEPSGSRIEILTVTVRPLWAD